MLAVLGSAILVLAPQKWTERMSTIPDAAKTDASAKGRLTAWELAIDIALDSPTGGGFQTWTPAVYENYGLYTTALVAHSIYFQMLGEHGVVGLALFLLLLFCCLRSCWRLGARYRRHPEASWIAAYADMVFISLLAFMSSGAFASRAYFDLFYQLVATVIILKYLATRQDLGQVPSTGRGVSADVLVMEGGIS
jgi:probable O-glycosylation ligase (exosortase A-associated)